MVFDVDRLGWNAADRVSTRASSSRKALSRTCIQATVPIASTMRTVTRAAAAVTRVRRRVSAYAATGSSAGGRGHGCARRTNPTPRTVWTTRGWPRASSLRRR